MTLSDVAEVKKLLEPDHTDHTNIAGISISVFFPQCFPVALWLDAYLIKKRKPFRFKPHPL